MRNPIIVALDGKTYDESVELASKLSGKVGAVKLNDLFFECGIAVVEEMMGLGCPVMLDGKFHDIPNTVKNTLRRLKDVDGIEIVTVHASGGLEMMSAAFKEMPGRIAAVTVLTSLDEIMCEGIYGMQPSGVVLRLAKTAYVASASYVVCSGHELGTLKGLDIKKIVPGIRPKWYQSKGDQKRTMTPHQAIEAGADYLVMGRAITTADDPVAAVERTLEEMTYGGVVPGSRRKG